MARDFAKRLVVLLAAGAALRLAMLGAKSLWFDEASTLFLARLPLAELPAWLVRNEVNPPLYYALMHCWLKAFADPRVGLRLFSALCGIGSLLAFRRLADALLPEKARLPALLFAALSSFWIHLAQDGRCYSLLLLVCLLSTRAALALAEKPARRLWAAYAALAALGLYTHYYYAILLAGHAAWLASRGRIGRGALAAHAAAAAAFLPWLGSFRAQAALHAGDPVVGEPLTIPRVLDLLGTTFFDVTFLGLALPAWAGAAVGAGFAALAASAAAAARRAPAAAAERRAAVFCLVHLAAGLALVFAVELWGGRPVTQARYFATLSPFVLLLAALGARAGWARAATAAVLLAGAGGYFFSAAAVDPRLAALSAEIRRSSGAAVPVVHLGIYYYLPLRLYYLPERRHLLIADRAAGMDYRGMPPYRGVVEEGELAGLGPCVVVDEARSLSPRRLLLGTGAELAALRRRL